MMDLYYGKKYLFALYSYTIQVEVLFLCGCTRICVCVCMFRWSELQVWQQGSLVKHVKGLFKAEGVSNAAEPGNAMHTRLYVSLKISDTRLSS